MCAAVSILARTALDVLHEHGGLELKTDSAERGELSFTVEKKQGGCSGILSYTADFLEKGFDSLQKEYPAYVSAEFVFADENDIQLTGGI